MSQEFYTKVIQVEGDRIYLERTSEKIAQDLVIGNTYNISIAVNNEVYTWEDVKIDEVKGEKEKVSLVPHGNPKVMNRRKFVRLNVESKCTVTVEGQQYRGEAINISAGGYAVKVYGTDLIDSKGKNINVTFDSLDFLEDENLEAVVIRATNDRESCIIGSRLLEENKAILEYVRKHTEKPSHTKVSGC